MEELDSLLRYLGESHLPMVFESITTINLIRVLHRAGLIDAQIPGTTGEADGTGYDGHAVVLRLTQAGFDAVKAVSEE